MSTLVGIELSTRKTLTIRSASIGYNLWSHILVSSGSVRYTYFYP